MSALDPSAPGLPIVPSGGSGGGLPASAIGDLLSGATPSRFVATDSGGASVGLTSAQAQIALGLVAQPDLSAITITDSGGASHVATASSVVITIPSGTASGAQSAASGLTWPSGVGNAFELVCRFAWTGTMGPGGVLAIEVGVDMAGAPVAGQYLVIQGDNTGGGNVRYDAGTSMGSRGSGGGASSLWLKLRVSGPTVTGWVAPDANFNIAAFVNNSTTVAGYFVDGTRTPTIGSWHFFGVMAGASATSDCTITIDNLTIRPVS